MSSNRWSRSVRRVVLNKQGGCPYVLSQGADTSFFKNIWWARNGRDDRSGNRLPNWSGTS